jgi:energy-coupling factor transporter ATP-binding protein EcfA2
MHVTRTQETLRAEFSGRTLLAVAHRLHTIIEADRVLVMAAGTAAEYGTPAALLADEDGAFSGKQTLRPGPARGGGGAESRGCWHGSCIGEFTHSSLK